MFRRVSLDDCPEIDPIESITMPSYCSKLYRFRHMPTNSIALIPPGGWSANVSLESLAWLAWMKGQLGLVELRHGRNNSEITLAQVKVDGFGRNGFHVYYALQYHGCW